MKISELTDEYIAEYLRAEYEGEEQTIFNYSYGVHSVHENRTPV